MEYQGHKNRAHWNVALFINNEYSLYVLATDCLQQHPTLSEAVHSFMAQLKLKHITHTPDGYKYSKSAVRAALSDLRKP